MARNINIFGTRFAYPKGLRKSPGSSSFNTCIGAAMSGKKYNSRAAVKAAFTSAAASCKGK